MNIVMSFIIGGIVGWLGSVVLKTSEQRGKLANVGAGVLGALVGLAVAYMMDFGPYGPFGSAVVCAVGAALTIAILESAGVFKMLLPAPR